MNTLMYYFKYLLSQTKQNRFKGNQKSCSPFELITSLPVVNDVTTG